MPEKRYELFEHTADLGLYIYGQTVEELFAVAVEALICQLVDLKDVRPVEERCLKVEAGSREELLRSWMAEVLYLYNGEGWITAGVEIKSLSDGSVSAILLGEPVDYHRHRIKGEVKAVTWHRLRIEWLAERGNWRASVVCDV